MSRASNTLITSDVLTTPIKIKYSSSYDSSSYYGAGMRVLSGVNGTITSTGSVPQTTLTYRSVRHLYYSNYLTGSFPVSASRAFNWEQSTAASGTFDADLRDFPTGSGDKVKILSIPREVFGEKIARRSFELVANDGASYRIVDDGNGNLIDIASDDLYVNQNYFNPNESFTQGYVYGSARNAHVGNILYAQGIIIITNPLYYNVLDAGPTVYNQLYTYLDTDPVKQFDPLLNAQPDSSPIDNTTLRLIPVPGATFPSYTITSGIVDLSPSDPLFTTAGNYSINYNVSSSIGTPSNTANIQVNILPDCNFTVAVKDYYSFGSPLLLYDFYDNLIYTNSGSTIRDLSVNGNDGIFSTGTGNGTPTTIAYYVDTPPSHLLIPGGYTNIEKVAVRLPNAFKFTGVQPYSFVAWVNLINLGAGGFTAKPGIVAAEGVSGGNPIGWTWYFDAQAGLTAVRHDGAGAGDSVTLNWSSTSYGTLPFNVWVYMFVTFDGLDTTVGVITPNGNYTQATSNFSPISISSSPNYGCFMGLRLNQYPRALFGYLASYNQALNLTSLNAIYTATKGVYGY